MTSHSQQSYQGKPLPRFVRDLLSAPPQRGGGLHNWLFRTARVLHPFRSREEIIDLLRAATNGEQVKSGEIESAVDSSAGCAWIPGATAMPFKKISAWPTLDQTKRAAIIASGAGHDDLWEMSPRTLHDESYTVLRADEFKVRHSPAFRMAREVVDTPVDRSKSNDIGLWNDQGR